MLKGADKLHFATQAVHAGERGPRPDFTPVTTPIYNSVCYVYDNLEELDAVFAGERPGYVYARFGNPTVTALEQAMAALEAGADSVAFSSGMAAIHASILAAGVAAGDSIVAAQDLYGGTYTMLAQVLASLGVRVQFVDVTDMAAVEGAIGEGPKAILLETVSNPLLKVADLPTIAEMAHRHGVEVLVDNTFTTPYLVRPLDHGADFVVHSATKYLGGHGDVMGGIAIASEENCAKLREIAKLTGGVLGPNEAWLILRGLKTLPLRMERHCENAARVAEWLGAHPRIARVYYPGLSSHPQHELASSLFRPGCYGGMVSFEIADGKRDSVFSFMNALRLCLAATSLGDVYTLLLYPAMSSHRTLTPEERAAIGIGDGLVRMSVGIEDVEDIIADLEQALKTT